MDATMMSDNDREIVGNEWSRQPGVDVDYVRPIRWCWDRQYPRYKLSSMGQPGDVSLNTSMDEGIFET